MGNDTQNPVLAYVEARIAAWQAVYSSLKAAMALDAGQMMDGVDLSTIAQNGEFGQPVDLPEGAFLGKSIPACIKLYLSSVKKKKTVKEIAAALKEGGVETTADSLEGPVTTALNRLKAASEVLRFKDGWGLPEWYPAHIRGAAPTTAPKRAKKKAKKSKAQGAQVSQVQPETTAAPKKPINDRILDALSSGKKAEYSLAEIGEQIGTGIFGTRLNVSKLVKAGKVEKTAHEKYRIPIPRLAAANM